MIYSMNIAVSLELTNTIASIGCQHKARFTDALKAAILVNAHPIQAHVCGCTLIVICKKDDIQLLEHTKS